MEYVLRTQNLTKQFGEKTAVKNVSMQIKKGEIYGFIGKNGAGKTTLMRLVLGAAMPTGGSIELFGGEESVNETRHRIGALLEYPCIYKNCTALENLRRFAILTGADTDELEDILDLVGLKGVGRAPGQTREFVRDYLNPIFEENKDILGRQAQINV